MTLFNKDLFSGDKCERTYEKTLTPLMCPETPLRNVYYPLRLRPKSYSWPQTEPKRPF